MTRNYFEKKYVKEIAAISDANNVDMFVAADMFESTIKGHYNICYATPDGVEVYTIYPGLPDDYDFAPAAVDLLGIKGAK